MRPAAVNGETPRGFIVFAAHNSVGSTVYVYDTIAGGGIREARENDVLFGGITKSVATLFCYKYDQSKAAGDIEKKAANTKFAPDPKDKAPARMVVAVAAE